MDREPSEIDMLRDVYMVARRGRGYDRNGIENGGAGGAPLTLRSRLFPGHLLPEHVIALVLCYLLLMWGAFFLIDAYDLFGVRAVLHAWEITDPFWFHLNRQGSITELLQWVTLGATAFAAGVVRGRGAANPAHVRGVVFWTLMGVAAVLMLIEDAGDPRHRLTDYVLTFAAMTRAEELGRYLVFAVELFYFSLLASIPLYALLRHGLFFRYFRKVKIYLLTGFLAYGAASVFSVTSYLNDWYIRAGGFVHNVLAGGQLYRVDWPYTAYHVHEFWLMDLLVEESIELLGAGALLAAALSYIQVLRQDSLKSKDEAQKLKDKNPE